MNIHSVIFFLCYFLRIGVWSKSPRIVGGRDAEISEAPHSASLRRISNDEHICSGSIISHWHILTAAHCVEVNIVTLNNLKIQIGATDISRPTGTFLYPDRIFVHPFMSRPSNVVPVLGDIAIIKVLRKIEFNRFQKSVTIPDVDYAPNSLGSISGWGIVNYLTGSISYKLQTVWMRIISNDECSALFRGQQYLDQFCALGNVGAGPCIGDSGTALVYRGIIVGIASISIPCGVAEPEMFTNVFYHLSFINRVLRM